MRIADIIVYFGFYLLIMRILGLFTYFTSMNFLKYISIVVIIYNNTRVEVSYILSYLIYSLPLLLITLYLNSRKNIWILTYPNLLKIIYAQVMSIILAILSYSYIIISIGKHSTPNIFVLITLNLIGFGLNIYIVYISSYFPSDVYITKIKYLIYANFAYLIIQIFINQQLGKLMSMGVITTSSQVFYISELLGTIGFFIVILLVIAYRNFDNFINIGYTAVNMNNNIVS